MTSADRAQSLSRSMSLAQYLFRYDRGAFQIGDASLWLARWHDWLTPTKLALALAAARTPFNVRALCDDLFAADTMYRRLHLAPPEAIASRLVLQDLFVPAERAAAAIAFCRERLTEPPCAIWLWPVRGGSDASSSPAPLAPNGHVPSTEVLLNLGIYTRAPASAPGGAVGFTKALEAWGLANGCRKLLYSLMDKFKIVYGFYQIVSLVPARPSFSPGTATCSFLRVALPRTWKASSSTWAIAK